MNADEDFENTIFVKTNLPEVLRRALARPAMAGERISIGTATDPYQPIEGKYGLTRRALEAMRDFRHPVSVVTKSTLIQRDLDLLAEIARLTEVFVFFTVTTIDPEIWRAVEPGTPPPLKRLQAMQHLREAGVPAGVFMAPVLPGITDAFESIVSVARAAKEHGAVSFGASPLRLAPMVKEHYLNFVAGSFPELLRRYERTYFGANAPRNYVEELDDRVRRALAASGFPRNTMSKREADRYPPPAHPVPAAAHVQQLLLLP